MLVNYLAFGPVDVSEPSELGPRSQPHTDRVGTVLIQVGHVDVVLVDLLVVVLSDVVPRIRVKLYRQ